MKTTTRIALRNPLNKQASVGSRWTRRQFYLATAAVMGLTCSVLLYSRQWLSSNDSIVTGGILLHPEFQNVTSNSHGGHVRVGDVLDPELFAPQLKSKPDKQGVIYGGEDHESLKQQATKERENKNGDPDDNAADTSASKNEDATTPKELGTIVLLAPQRNTGTFWDIDRFCLFIRAVRSIDQFLNSRYGPYPVHVLLAKDHALDPEGKDGPYTDEDRALIRMWAPNTTIHFVQVNMYSEDAFEPGATMEQAVEWKKAMPHQFHHGVGYASMCRLWSGRLQQMEFLQRYEYYMRMDDDSLLVGTPSYDPFQKMKDEKLMYVYRRGAFDHWGVRQLWDAASPFVKVTGETPFVSGSSYNGMQPYNNFHITKVSFWTTPQWLKIWEAMNREHVFFQHRAGDANVHAIACMLMTLNQRQVWSDFPYRHNSNDYGGWAPPQWREECEAEYVKYLPIRQQKLQSEANATTIAKS